MFASSFTDHLPALLPAVTLVSCREELGEVVVKSTGPVGAAMDTSTSPDMMHDVIANVALHFPAELPVKLRETPIASSACWPVTTASAAHASSALSQ
jgi:hypothetical protein